MGTGWLGLAEERGFPRTGFWLGLLCGQPLGHSSILPADGSVCMGTKVTASVIPSGGFCRAREHCLVDTLSSIDLCFPIVLVSKLLILIISVCKELSATGNSYPNTKARTIHTIGFFLTSPQHCPSIPLSVPSICLLLSKEIIAEFIPSPQTFLYCTYIRIRNTKLHRETVLLSFFINYKLQPLCVSYL